MMYTKHSQEIYNQVAELYKKGMRTAEIGKVVGIGKNSICGILFRGRQKGMDVPKSVKKPHVGRPRRIKAERRSPSQLRFFFVAEDPQIIIDPPLLENGLTFEQLKSSSCRYVLNEGRPENFIFCGETKTNGPYCSYHSKLCYMPPEKRNGRFLLKQKLR